MQWVVAALTSVSIIVLGAQGAPDWMIEALGLALIVVLVIALYRPRAAKRNPTATGLTWKGRQ